MTNLWYILIGEIVHLLFWLCILALLCATASTANALLVYVQHRRPVALHVAGVLSALFLIALSMTLHEYSALATPPASYRAGVVSLVTMLAGASWFVFIAPIMSHSLVGHEVQGRLRALYVSIAVVFVLLAVSLFVRPTARVVMYAINVLFLGMGVFALVFLAVRRARVSDARVRAAIRDALLLVLVFLPLVYLDSRTGWLPEIPVLSTLDGATLPVFLILLNLFAIRFIAGYLSEPPYTRAGKVTTFFRQSYDISELEGRIVRLVMEHWSSLQIADHLSISRTAVENHVHSICRKTGLRDREHLAKLMLEHRG